MKNSLSALVTLVLVLALCQCSKPVQDLSALETELGEAKERLSALRKRIGAMRDELGRAASSTDEQQTVINSCLARRKEFEAALDVVKDELLAHNKAYRESIRSRAPGMTLENFEALGRQFSNVVVKHVDDWELAFKHSSGMSRIKLADAPPEVRIMFAYNPNVGPKPAPVEVASAAAEPLPELLTAAAASEAPSTSSSSGSADDPFVTHPRGATEYTAPPRNTPSGLSSANTLGRFVSREGRQQRQSRCISMSDGSAVEVIASW